MIEHLKEWLRENKRNYVDVRMGSGGCDTCGYGAEEIEAINMDDLWKEIDAFVADFKSKKIAGEILK